MGRRDLIGEGFSVILILTDVLFCKDTGDQLCMHLQSADRLLFWKSKVRQHRAIIQARLIVASYQCQRMASSATLCSDGTGFNFDLVQRNALLKNRGVKEPTQRTTGTTLAGLIFKV